MQAAIFEDRSEPAVREVPVPTVDNPQDVLTNVEASGVCGTDVRIVAVTSIVWAKRKALSSDTSSSGRLSR